MPRYFALLSIVYMIAFVLLFDRMRWRRRFKWTVWASNLMSQLESERLLKIVAASCEKLTFTDKEVAQ